MSTFQKDTYLTPRDTKTPKKFPDISKPEIVGYFSVNKERCYIPDARNCKYIKRTVFDRQQKLDLNDGYEKVVHKPDNCVEEKINHLLRFIVRNLDKFQAKSSDEFNEEVLSINVVCFRGLLRLLMCTPYEYRDNWSILATKYKGTIYLCALETDERKSQRQNESSEMKRILSYGFKFEQYMMSDKARDEPNPTKPVYESEEFCCMFKTRLMGRSVLYGAEMDGIEADEEIDFDKIDMNKLEFVELKVKLREERESQRINYQKFKLRNWWCQCFLVNIRKILIGVRNRDGIVDQLMNLDVKSIPKQVQNFWSPAVCMKFCGDFLQLVDDEMKDINCPFTVYKFDCDPRTRSSIKLTAFKGKNSFSFLPEWYILAIR